MYWLAAFANISFMLAFGKYHGLGNDFVIIDDIEDRKVVTALDAVALCRRHAGVGADGVLVLKPAQDCDALMEVFNADGTNAGMCGNGLRCAAKYLHDTRVPKTRPGIRLRSALGIHECLRISDDRYRVTMGKPVWSHAELPESVAKEGRISLHLPEGDFVGTSLWFGNPHLVIFNDSAEEIESLIHKFGSGLENHPAFPNRVNVTFAAFKTGGFKAVVHERGVGITAACGSAACALGVSAVLRGLWPVAESLVVEFRGGSLSVVVEKDGTVSQEGEAIQVFRGEVDWL